MPLRGINFEVSKQCKTVFSQNRRTIVTREWENNLIGFSLAYHRADKATTIAHGRAITKLTKTHN